MTAPEGFRCPQCERVKERAEFPRTGRWGQRVTLCTTCTTAAREDWYRKNAVAVAERLAHWRARQQTRPSATQLDAKG